MTWHMFGVYLLILFVKIFEVTLGTMRIVLVTKGEKYKGAFIGFFEVMIWVVVVSQVLKDVTSDPIKVFVYALGFSLGNFVGASLEQRLGLGTVRIEAIVKEVDGEPLVAKLRENGFAVTVVRGDGMNHRRYVLIMHVQRKRTAELVELIKYLQDNVVITVNEVKPIYGGFGMIKR